MFSGLKPKIQGDSFGLDCLFWCVSSYLRLSTGKQFDCQLSQRSTRLFAQVQLVDQLFIAISLRSVQIIEQTPPLRDHLEEAATRGVILGVALQVFGQMLDPAREKCDLHIRATSIFIMQLELLEVQHCRALCHKRSAYSKRRGALSNYGSRRALTRDDTRLYVSAVRFSRLPSYQTSSLSRERAAVGPPTTIENNRTKTRRSEYMRNFRPEVTIGSRSTLNRPSFLRARLK